MISSTPRTSHKQRLAPVGLLGLLALVANYGMMTHPDNARPKIPPTDEKTLPPPTAQHEWISQRATAWQSCRLDCPLSSEERAAVDRIVGDASVIGLGEMTHGSRELFQARVRLLKYLVAERGVRFIVLETCLAGTLRLNEHVVSGTGTAPEALAAAEYWSTVNAESLELLNWLQQSSRALRDEKDRIEVWGCDVQSLDNPNIELRRMLAEFASMGVAPSEQCQAAASLLESLPADRELYRHVEALVSAASAPQPDSQQITAIQAERAQYMSAVNQSVAAAAKQLRSLPLEERIRAQDRFLFVRCIRLLEQSAQFYSPDGERERDRLMAENLDALRQHFAGRKMAIVAHNLHLSRIPISIRGETFVSLGCQLSRELQDNYKVIGSCFHGGAFLASAGETSATAEVAQAHIPKVTAWEHHFQAYCLARGMSALLVEVGPRPVTDTAGTETLEMRLGEAGGQGLYEDCFVRQDFRSQYDGLVFIQESTSISVLPEYYARARAKWGTSGQAEDKR